MKTEIALDRDNFLAERSSWIDTLARKILHSKLSGITRGTITIHDTGSTHVFGVQTDDDMQLSTEIHVKHSSFYSDIVFGGTVGSGESYMTGKWTCNDLTTLVRIILQNRHVLDQLDGGIGKAMMPVNRLYHYLHGIREAVAGLTYSHIMSSETRCSPCFSMTP